MLFVYLFEAKSIQSYLFKSGKLKDLIAASERLDRLIDTDTNSVLGQVLAQLCDDSGRTYRTDLECVSTEPAQIRFLRCKGGALYCFSQQAEPLQKLRSLLTLTVQQLFPSLSFVDALCSGNDLASAMAQGHGQLKQRRQAQPITLPYAEAICQRYARTGHAAVPVSPAALKARMGDEADKDNEFDLDTERHRQAYQNVNLREQAALQDRFTPVHLRGQVFYPINFDKDFEFAGDQKTLNKSQREAVKDLALIHIDGNGLGQLLMALRDALKGNDVQYQSGFRQFSDALSKSTLAAAQDATDWLYQQVLSEGEPKYDHKNRLVLPMRPLVLGGDDITLFCRADLALTYARTFCQAFKKHSQVQLEGLYRDYLQHSEIADHLTASGGILYHKAGHPFMACHHLVEQLCAQAKQLTKTHPITKGQAAPAALSWYRISSISQQSLQQLQDNTGFEHANYQSRGHYFVDAQYSPSFAQLEKVLTHPVGRKLSHRWRQMATLVAQGDVKEAQRIFDRGLELQRRNKNEAELRQLEQEQKNFEQLLRDLGAQPLNDLLIFMHYQLAGSEEISA